MGIDFRGSRYKKDVTMGKRTVKDGEAAAIWNRYGEHRQVLGPRLVRLFYSTINFLDRHTASPTEYLRITKTDGTIEHMRGPAAIFQNPVFHSAVEVLPSFKLPAASDCIVVVREPTPEPGNRETVVGRVVVKGPGSYFPAVGDTVVHFSWHGRQQSSNLDAPLQPDANAFHVLSVAPRALTLDFPINSSAKVKGKLKLVIRFSISDVVSLVDRTSDPIAELYEAMSLDITSTATLGKALPSIDSFIEEGKLTDILNFPRVAAFAGACGIDIEAISFRGYEPHPDLKKSEENSREFDLKLNRDKLVAEQEAIKIATDLKAREARLEQEQGLASAVLAGKQASLDAEQQFRERQQKYDEELAATRVQSQLNYHVAVNNESLRVLKELAAIGADVTKLLCHTSTQQSPSGGIGGKSALITVSPALQEWFSVPEYSAGNAQKADKHI